MGSNVTVRIGNRSATYKITLESLSPDKGAVLSVKKKESFSHGLRRLLCCCYGEKNTRKRIKAVLENIKFDFHKNIILSNINNLVCSGERIATGNNAEISEDRNCGLFILKRLNDKFSPGKLSDESSLLNAYYNENFSIVTQDSLCEPYLRMQKLKGRKATQEDVSKNPEAFNKVLRKLKSLEIPCEPIRLGNILFNEDNKEFYPIDLLNLANKVEFGDMVGEGTQAEIYSDPSDSKYVIKSNMRHAKDCFLEEEGKCFTRVYGPDSAKIVYGDYGKPYLKMLRIPGVRPVEETVANNLEAFDAMIYRLYDLKIVHPDLFFGNILFDETTKEFHAIDINNDGWEDADLDRLNDTLIDMRGDSAPLLRFKRIKQPDGKHHITLNPSAGFSGFKQ